ncbi:MAG: PIG-L family deacetylase [Armatimonadetes bacterium]|nr:PIG-L family deacetylase [Armatimonadota bacterium]
MKFHNSSAELFLPDGASADFALARTTHLGVSAHQDDLEITAYDGILRCFGRDDRWFTGVVVTNGAGSPRDDLYAAYSNEDMRKVRKREQKKAAVIGEYSACAMLDYPSSAVKDPEDRRVLHDLEQIIRACAPSVIYTHNLADKHDTHVAVAARVIKTLRDLPKEVRPKQVYGCEVWRDLDWMNDEDKVAFDVAGHENLAASLLGVFDSQICGGKRYDLATIGRRRAHATYYASHGTDITTAMMFAMDLTPLVDDPQMNIKNYVTDYIRRFEQDVLSRLSRFIG